MANDNLIKQTCKELGLTYKQLGELIGYTEGGIKNAIAKNEVSEPMKKAIEMLLKIKELESEIQTHTTFKQAFKNFLNTLN